jgi:phospholipase/carboxylesterase
VTSGGDLAEDERGGTAVVLLHGFGASGDDLVSLARSLANPRTRYVVPAGLLALPNGGRAWWPLKQRLAYNAEQELQVPSDALESARTAVHGVVRTIRERYAPTALFVAGFSQGAMLALDVALQGLVSCFPPCVARAPGDPCGRGAIGARPRRVGCGPSLSRGSRSDRAKVG